MDEYQDSSPAQESLLRALAGDGRELIAVGDPDQSIYAFRGADVRAITEFCPDRFRAADGSPAPVVALGTNRRSGPALIAASRRIARHLSGGHAGHRDLPGRARRRAWRDPDRGRGERESQEAALIADTLRRAHLADGIGWSSMAILVRSAIRQVPLLRRALSASGVPVSVAGDELPLPEEPGTRPLLTLLRCALRPGALDEQTATELLTGPLGGTDALGLRRLRRWLRVISDTAGADSASDGPRRTYDPGDLMTAAILDPRELIMVPPAVAAPAEKLARLLSIARDAIAAGQTAEETLGRLGRLRPRPGLAGRQCGGRCSGSGGRPGSRRRTGPVRRGQPVRRHAAPRRAGPVHRRPRQPGDRRRHAGRAGHPGRGGPHPDRAPVQGPGVGPGRGGRCPGRNLARPAPARFSAGHRRARRRGVGGQRRRRRRGRRRPGIQAPGREAPGSSTLR